MDFGTNLEWSLPDRLRRQLLLKRNIQHFRSEVKARASFLQVLSVSGPCGQCMAQTAVLATCSCLCQSASQSEQQPSRGSTHFSRIYGLCLYPDICAINQTKYEDKGELETDDISHLQSVVSKVRIPVPPILPSSISPCPQAQSS
eukprot:1156372-Pelagomonas_calceolata.AAC.5